MVGGTRAVARCDALGVRPYSDSGDGLYRGYLTPAYAEAQRAVGRWMVEAGMRIRLDPAANLVGRYEGSDPAARPLLIGSHLDSVRDGGRYDGPLGIMLGIECVAALHAEGRRLPFPIEIYAFGDEEGSRFPAAMLTSRAVAGTLDPAALDMADADGAPLAEALRQAGLDAATYATARHPGALAYLEAHIEQGPVLEAEDLPVGVVTGIAAQRRAALTVTGRAGHAGTTAMPLRRDALAAAAAMVLAAEEIARSGPADLVATVGRLEVAPGAANVVPGRVTFTLDVRAGDTAIRDAAASAILARCRAIAADRALALSAEPLQDLPASPCDPALTDLLGEAIAAHGIVPRRLVSGAGHDAMVMAALCPTAMLFIRCKGGISHNPAESIDPADAEVALAVMRRFLDRLGERFGD
jgi:allantoate deiminase